MDLARLTMEVDSTKVKTATKDLEKLEKSGAKAEAQARSLGRSAKATNQDFDGLNRGLARADNTVRNLVAGFLGFQAARRAVTVITEFEQTMATLRGVAIDTNSTLAAQNAQFEKLQATARELGSTTRFSASESAEGLLFLARAGFDTEEAITAVGSTLNLAQAGLLSLGEAADFASNIVSQFNLNAAETTRVVDVLVTTSNSANTDVRQLAEALKFAGPVAGALGRSVEETAAALGALGDSGIQASLAGTNLRGILAALLGPTSGAADRLGSLGLSLDQLNPQTNDLVDIFTKLQERSLSAGDAVEIFGRRNAAAALVLVGNADRVAELADQNERAAGAADELAKIQDDTLRGSLLGLRSAFEEALLAGGDKGLAGVFRSLVDNSRDVIRILVGVDEGLSKGNDNARAFANSLRLVATGVVVAAFAGLALNIAAATSAAAGFAVTLKSINTVLVANPFLALAAGIGAATVAFKLFTPEVVTTEERLRDLGVATSSVGESMSSLRAAFSRAFESGDVADQVSAIRGQISVLEAEAVRLTRVLSDVEQADFRSLDSVRGALGEFSRDLLTEIESNLATFLLEAQFKIEEGVIGAIASRGDAGNAAVGIFNQLLKEGGFEPLAREAGNRAALAFRTAFRDTGFTDIGVGISAIFAEVGDDIATVALPADRALALIEKRVNLLKVEAERLDAELSTQDKGESFSDIEARVAEAAQLREGKQALDEYLDGLRSELRVRRSLSVVSKDQEDVVRALFRANDQLDQAGIFDRGVRADVLTTVESITRQMMALKDATEETKDATDDFGRTLSELQFDSALRKASSSLTDFAAQVRTDVNNIGDAFENLFDTVLNNLINNFFLEFLTKLGTGTTGPNLFGRLLGIGFGPPAQQNALGNIHLGSGQVQKFGAGGFTNADFITGPTLFDRGNGRLGLAGEAGTEVAIAPLDRTDGGKLGVNVSGLTGGTTNVYMTVVTRDANSFNLSRGQIERDMRSSVRRTF